MINSRFPLACANFQIVVIKRSLSEVPAEVSSSFNIILQRLDIHLLSTCLMMELFLESHKSKFNPLRTHVQQDLSNTIWLRNINLFPSIHGCVCADYAIPAETLHGEASLSSLFMSAACTSDTFQETSQVSHSCNF